MKEPKTLNGKILRKLRQEVKLTQEMLAAFIDRSQPYISYLERGQIRLTPYIKRRLIDVFGNRAQKLEEGYK